MEPPTNLQSLFKTFDNFIKNMSDSEKNFLILNFGKNLNWFKNFCVIFGEVIWTS